MQLSDIRFLFDYDRWASSPGEIDMIFFLEEGAAAEAAA